MAEISNEALFRFLNEQGVFKSDGYEAADYLTIDHMYMSLDNRGILDEFLDRCGSGEVLTWLDKECGNSNITLEEINESLNLNLRQEGWRDIGNDDLLSLLRERVIENQIKRSALWETVDDLVAEFLPAEPEAKEVPLSDYPLTAIIAEVEIRIDALRKSVEILKQAANEG